MRNNPVFLESINLPGKRITLRIFLLIYISIFSVLLLMFLSNASGNILSPGFNPPDLFRHMVTFGQISSSILLLLCFSILSFGTEETLNWIIHGKLNLRQVLAGRILIALLLTFIFEVTSIPWFIYAAHVSSVPDFIAVWAIFFNGIAVFTYGQIWILGGFLFNKYRVTQTIFIWVYIFVYLLISAKILPFINPILILNSVNKDLLNNPGVYTALHQIYPIVIINLFLFLFTLAAAFLLWVRKVRINE